MKDLFYLQQKTWFQFRKIWKNLVLKTSISSMKDLMIWWKTYIFFNERLDSNSERLAKILVWRLLFLQQKTWCCDERLAKFWFEDFHIFNERLDDVRKDLSISSTKDLMMWWKTYFFFKKRLDPRNLRNTSFFFNERLDDLMKDWLEGDLKVIERLLLLHWKTWWLWRELQKLRKTSFFQRKTWWFDERLHF